MAAGPTRRWTSFRRAQADAPVLVFIHGGYWRSLDKSDHSFVAPAFTREGACVVMPNYALCPAVTIPQITHADGAGAWPGPGGTSRSTAATRAASRWRATRRAATWRR